MKPLRIRQVFTQWCNFIAMPMRPVYTERWTKYIQHVDRLHRKDEQIRCTCRVYTKRQTKYTCTWTLDSLQKKKKSGQSIYRHFTQKGGQNISTYRQFTHKDGQNIVTSKHSKHKG